MESGAKQGSTQCEASGCKTVSGLTSIIVPTCNRASLLAGLVDSLLHCLSENGPAVEILVVDNNSNEPDAIGFLDSLPELVRRSHLYAVRVLRYPHKFNYSAINNFAVNSAQGEFLCFLNNDVEVISRFWLDSMLQSLGEPRTGCVGARLYYPDGRIQHAGIVVGVETIAGHIYKNAPPECGGHGDFLKHVQTVSAVTGACLLVRRSVFELVGGFDEKLAVSFNDVDLCLRVEREGYVNRVVPEATLYHFESRSRGLQGDRTRNQRRLHKLEIAYMRRKWGARLLGVPVELQHWEESRRSLQLIVKDRERVGSQCKRLRGKFSFTRKIARDSS